MNFKVDLLRYATGSNFFKVVISTTARLRFLHCSPQDDGRELATIVYVLINYFNIKVFVANIYKCCQGQIKG